MQREQCGWVLEWCEWFFYVHCSLHATQAPMTVAVHEGGEQICDSGELPANLNDDRDARSKAT